MGNVPFKACLFNNKGKRKPRQKPRRKPKRKTKRKPRRKPKSRSRSKSKKKKKKKKSSDKSRSKSKSKSKKEKKKKNACFVNGDYPKGSYSEVNRKGTIILPEVFENVCDKYVYMNHNNEDGTSQFRKGEHLYNFEQL